MVNVVIFGAPGAGKGTQAKNIVDKYKLEHLSTGDIFREEMKAGTEIGKEVKQVIDGGNLVPDELTVKVLADRMAKTPDADGFLFDGFPRTINQAQMLDKKVAETSQKIDFVISLSVPEAELINRIILRGKESGRADDNEVAVKNRLEVFKNQTMPLIDYYKQQGNFHEVDGVGSLDDIFERIQKIMG